MAKPRYAGPCCIWCLPWSQSEMLIPNWPRWDGWRIILRCCLLATLCCLCFAGKEKWKVAISSSICLVFFFLFFFVRFRCVGDPEKLSYQLLTDGSDGASGGCKVPECDRSGSGEQLQVFCSRSLHFTATPLPLRGPLESSSVVAVEMQVGIGIGSAYGHDVRCTWANWFMCWIRGQMAVSNIHLLFVLFYLLPINIQTNLSKRDL